MSFLGSPAANWPLLACLYPLALFCGVICTWLFYVVRTEVNQKVAEPHRISALIGYPGLLPKVERLHRQFYPPKSSSRRIEWLHHSGAFGGHGDCLRSPP